jgi:hypothetical protein
MNQELIDHILKIVSRAPSAHNTQPVSWKFSQNKIEMYISENRLLHVSDKEMRDIHLAAGAAFFLLRGALFEEGLKPNNIKLHPLVFKNGKALYLETETSALQGEKRIFNLDLLKTHACYRGKFEKGKKAIALKTLNTVVVDDPGSIKKIAELYDNAAAFFLSQKEYAEELWSWLRLDRSDKRYYRDGLNGDMLRLDSILLFFSRFLMKPQTLFWLGKFGLIKTIITEAPQNLSAEGYVLLVRDESKTLFDQGQDLMAMWFELEESGRHFCPVTSLIDHSDFQKKLAYISQVDKEIIHVLRMGVKPKSETQEISPRLPLEEINLK